MRERIENAIMLGITLLACLYIAKFAGCIAQFNGGFYSAPFISVPR